MRAIAGASRRHRALSRRLPSMDKGAVVPDEFLPAVRDCAKSGPSVTRHAPHYSDGDEGREGD